MILLKLEGLLQKMKHVKLSSGYDMPIVGLGTWKELTGEAVEAALDCGYRHIDTAFNYNNEENIGTILQKWFSTGKGNRADIFITTKLPNFGNRASDVERFLNLSLGRLQLDYVDLYLVHMPFSLKCNESTLTPLVNEDGTFSLDCDSSIIETWKKLEEQVKKGLVKSIGLSNFNAEQVKRVFDNAEIKPSVLQVELHAYLQQKELRQVCKDLNIAVTAYAPLGSPGANQHFSNKYNYVVEDFPDILGHPLVKELASKYNKTPGQILLKHLLQQGIIIIPKSGNPERIKQNIDLFDFEISEEDMEKLNGLDRGESGRIFDFFFLKGVEKHPEYPFKAKVNA